MPSPTAGFPGGAACAFLKSFFETTTLRHPYKDLVTWLLPLTQCLHGYETGGPASLLEYNVTVGTGVSPLCPTFAAREAKSREV